MIKQFKNLGALGLITDVDARSLPDNAWTKANNIRFTDNEAKKTNGFQEIFTTPSTDPMWLMPVINSDAYWVYPSINAIHVTDSTINTDITRASGDYSAS